MKGPYHPLLFLATLALINCAGCSKDDGNRNLFSPIVEIPVSENFEGFIFKSGSAWGYQNSQNFDVMTVIANGSERIVFERSPSSPGTGPTTFDFVDFGLEFPEKFGTAPRFGAHNSMYTADPTHGGNTLFLNLEDQPTTTADGYYWFKANHAVYAVGLQTFEDVTEFQLSVSDTANYFIARNIGIIRKEVIRNGAIDYTIDLLSWDVEPEDDFSHLAIEIQP